MYKNNSNNHDVYHLFQTYVYQVLCLIHYTCYSIEFLQHMIILIFKMRKQWIICVK